MRGESAGDAGQDRQAILTYAAPLSDCKGVELHRGDQGHLTVRIGAEPMWRQMVARATELTVVLLFVVWTTALTVATIDRMGFRTDLWGLFLCWIICVAALAYSLIKLVNTYRFGARAATLEASGDGLIAVYATHWGMRQRRLTQADVFISQAARDVFLRRNLYLHIRSGGSEVRLYVADAASAARVIEELRAVLVTPKIGGEIQNVERDKGSDLA